MPLQDGDREAPTELHSGPSHAVSDGENNLREETSPPARPAEEGYDGGNNLEELLIYLQRMSRCGAELTFVVAALTQGSFGSFMSGVSLWVCWAILLLKLLMDFSIRPSWVWVISYLRSRSEIHRQTGRRPISCPACGTSAGLALTRDDGARGEVSTASIKCVLAIVLLLKAQRHPELSTGCSLQPPCSDRARESMRGLAVMVMVLEGIPLLLSGAVQATGAGFMNRVNRSFHLLCHSVYEFKDDESLTWLEFALILQSFHASASSAVLVSTAGILVGGNFANFMTRRCFWLCWLVVVVELLAEGACPIAVALFRHWIPAGAGYSHTASAPTPILPRTAPDQTSVHSDLEINSLKQITNRQLKEEARAKLLLRVPLQVILFSFLFQTLREQNYYPPNLDDRSCDAICKANTKAILQVVCIFTGSQVLSIFPLWAPFQILAALLPAFLAYALVVVIMAIGPLGMLGFLAFATFVDVAGRNSALVIAGTLIILYSLMYMTTNCSTRTRLIPKMHHVFFTPVVALASLAYSFSLYITPIPGYIVISLLICVYAVLLCRGITKDRQN